MPQKKCYLRRHDEGHKNEPSQQAKWEVVERLRHRYLQASRIEKTRILDEFVALSGLHRKSAIRALRQGYERGSERRG